MCQHKHGPQGSRGHSDSTGRETADRQDYWQTNSNPTRDNPWLNSIVSQLDANHQTTTSLLLNLKAAINSLAGQVQRAEEDRGDVTARLVDTLYAFHQDRQPAATSDKVTQTHVTTPRPIVMADWSLQVSGRALPLPLPLPPPGSRSSTTPPLPLLPPTLSPSHPFISLRKTDETSENDHHL